MAGKGEQSAQDVQRQPAEACAPARAGGPGGSRAWPSPSSRPGTTSPRRSGRRTGQRAAPRPDTVGAAPKLSAYGLQDVAALLGSLGRLALVLGGEPAPLSHFHPLFPVPVGPTSTRCPPSRGRLNLHEATTQPVTKVVGAQGLEHSAPPSPVRERPSRLSRGPPYLSRSRASLRCGRRAPRLGHHAGSSAILGLGASTIPPYPSGPDAAAGEGRDEDQGRRAERRGGGASLRGVPAARHRGAGARAAGSGR